jgi:hypothetical protein
VAMLPTNYDDLNRSDWDTRRSWKHNSFKRKQWM